MTVKHGTWTGYVHHRCRCDDCRAANAREHVRLRAQRTPEMAREHGTYSTYNNYGCRCPLCAAAAIEYQRCQRARRRHCDECGVAQRDHDNRHEFEPPHRGRPRKVAA